MKKHCLIGIVLTFFTYFLQSQPIAAVTVSTDTLFYVDFVNKPGAFTTGDIYTASTGNINKEKTVSTVVFGAGPNGQRINMNTTQSASQFGSSATTYVSATADDDGATAGAFSFIKAGASSGGGGYIILPDVQGPADITVWACGASTSATQSYKIWTSADGGTTWAALGTASFTDLKLIHKNVFSYTQNGTVKVKLECTTGSNANCNLYIYDVLMTKRPYISLTSAIGTDNQTVSVTASESITNIVYTWSSIANAAPITWTGTADANTPPTGITVTTDATTKTVTISGTPTALGTYTYSITGTNGTISTSALTGTIKVVSTPVPLIGLTSATGTNIQKVTSGVAMTNVEYTWSGSATDAQIVWTGTASSSTAPDGITVTKDVANEKMTISGTPTTTGTYGWSITSGDGTFTSSALTGTLTVVPPPTITLTSDAATTSQTVGFCQSITPVVVTYGGSATSASLTWSGTTSTSTPPPGITVTTNTTNKTITISGMMYQTGAYGFSSTSTDGTLTSSAITGTLTSSATASFLPSFPGAVGYGSHATGGRGGSVYHVTNLDDSGTGSFRDAVSASNRIVVFDVGGYINLKTAVSCKSNLTIAGQTAPGAGIGFRGGEISFATQQNIICRHIRIVPGSETADPKGDDALSLYNARNVIMDHCTFEFAPWNNIDGVSDNYGVTPVTAITLQNCIDANPTYQQFGAHCESVIAQWTFYRNLFANSHNRNPLAKINDQFINNVEYNNEAGYTTHSGTSFKHDIVNNYFVWGPASGSNVPWFQIDDSQSIYYPGNLCDNNKDGVLNGTTTTPYWYSGPGTILTSPWSPLTATIPTVDAPSAYRTVVSKVGTLPLSELDSLIVNQVKTLGLGTAGYTAGSTGPVAGLYTDQTQTGLANNGYGTILSGSKETDTDNDGMPDYWEIATGSDVNTNDAMQIGSNGYTLIENYINWIADLHAKTYVSTPLDIDLSKYTGGFSSVSPVYSISAPTNGNTALQADGHTVRFTPTTDFKGIGSFKFTVTGSDNTTYSDSVKIAISGIAPLVPIAATNFVPANQSANIDTLNLSMSWTAGANTTSFTVYGGTDKNNLTALASNITSPTYTWAQLFAGTIYYWRVDAVNANGTTTGSVLSFTTKYRTPGKVTGMIPVDQAVNVDTLNLAMSWTSGANTSSFTVYGGTDKNSLTALASNVSNPAYVWPQLTAGTVYYWRVDAVNPTASTTGNVLSFTTKYRTPGKVTGMVPVDLAVNVDTLNLAMSWNSASNATKYNVYMGTDANNLTLKSGNVTATSLQVSDLKGNTKYYWRVDAVNGSETTTGNVISFTTKARVYTGIPELMAKTLIVYPNPFTDKLFVKFNIDAKERITLAVYDLSGKLVWILEDTVLPSGSYEYNWNGKDTNGQQVSGGLYLLMIKAGNNQTVKKINYIKQ